MLGLFHNKELVNVHTRWHHYQNFQKLLFFMEEWISPSSTKPFSCSIIVVSKRYLQPLKQKPRKQQQCSDTTRNLHF